MTRTAMMLLAALLVGACDTPKKEEPAAPDARFGVFFGGQVQERREVPFELDRGKQSLGFRVDFGAPLAEDTRVEWQMAAPTPTGRSRGGAAATPPPPRIDASDVAHAGETRFERITPLEAGDPLGLWNVRVVAGGKVVIDRPFEVFDPIARARAAKADGGF